MELPHPEDSYESRDIEAGLYDAARKWLRPESALHWVSLRSKPGNGNSSLLRHFRKWLREYEVGFGNVRVIFVDGESATYPKVAGPLIKSLAELKSAVQGTRLRQLMRRVRYASAGRKMAAVSILLITLSAASVLSGISEYNKSPDAPWRDVFLWSQGLVKFLAANWYKLPVWLFSDAISGILLSFAFSSVILYLSRGRLFPQSARERVGREDLRALKSYKHLVEALYEVTHGCRGLILLIDEAHLLTDFERRLLVDLARPVPERPELEAFVGKRRVLIVTLESHQVSWVGRSDETSLVLDVPEFTLDALDKIARRQLKEGFEHLRESEQVDLLQKARENINTLFARRAESYDDEMGRLFTRAREEGIEDLFDQAELMAYWAVAHEDSVRKGEMVRWLESPAFREHLREFGLRPPKDPDKSVKDFNSSTLVRREGQTYFFRVSRCQALQRWLMKQSEDSGRLLARAHYFWFRSLSEGLNGSLGKPDSAAALAEADQTNVREAAWHAIQVGSYLNSPHDVLADARGLTDSERRERGCKIAAVLISASVVCRSEGDTVESSDLVVDALEWLSDTPDADEREWIECGAEQLWRNFWVSGSPTEVNYLADVSARFPWLTDSPHWQVNRRLEQLLRCDGGLPPPPDATAIPHELLNLHRLTEALREVRQRYGPFSEGLHDTSINIHEPLEMSGKSLPELHLRHMQAAALSQRNEQARLDEVLTRWRERLKETTPTDTHLGSCALHYYDEARYWHLLADACRMGVIRIEEDLRIPKEAEAEAIVALFESVRGACLTPPPAGASLPDYLWQEAQAGYDRALKIMAFLYWRPLVMEASFRLGELLCNHTPLALRAQEPEPWWWNWNNLFWQTVRLEKEFGWTIHTPLIYRIRWKFFEHEEDNECSVEDAYNALQAARRANYPRRLVLAWHRQARVQFINHSNSDKDRVRDAELNEEWADGLAVLPEAVEFWEYEKLEHEQADALHFAAQARRLLDDIEAADALLDRAEALLGPSADANARNGNRKVEPEAEPKSLRDLRISIKLQRAWVRKSQRRKADYEAAILDLWKFMQVEDEDGALVLQCLTELEAERNALGDRWPPPGSLPRSEPHNRKLSLPSEWFCGSPPLVIKNRFEFRFYQLLNLINYSARLGRLDRSSGTEQLIDPGQSATLYSLKAAFDDECRRTHQVGNVPRLLFSPEMLNLLAQLRWLGVNKLAEVGRAFAEYGRVYPHSAETRAIIVNLLDAARFYFAEVQPVVSDELTTLRLLIHYDPASPKNYRLQYVRVLYQHEHLLRYESLSLEGSGGADWYAVARDVDGYLSVLVDATLQFNSMNLELKRHNVSPEDFLGQREMRGEMLRQAEGEYARGETESCLLTITHALPPEKSPWVFIEDLRALDLWLRCAQHQEVTPEEIQRRDVQLRAHSQQFIRQFRVIVNDDHVQQLTIRILSAVHDAVAEPE